MPHTTDILALGIKLEVDDGASNAYAEVLNITDINGPKSEVADVKANYLNQGSFIDRKLAGMIDAQTISWTQEFAEDEYARFTALLRVPHNWRLSVYDQEASPVLLVKITFAGFLKSYEGIDADDPGKLLMCKGTVTRTSALTIATS